MIKQEEMALTSNKGNGMPATTDASSIASVMLNEKRFPKYRNIPQQGRLGWMSAEIKTLASIIRVKDFDAREAVATSVVLDDMIMQDRFLSDLTLPEIHSAFRNGVFGLYGEFYGIGISSPNLYGFLNSYLVSDKKVDANKIVRQQKEKEYEARKQKEREEEQKRLRAEIEEAKRNGTFVPNPAFKGLQLKTVDEVLREKGN